MLDAPSNGCTGEGSINLAEAALHVAAEDDALVSHGSVQLPLQPYQQRIQRLASDIAARLERLGPMASDRRPEAVLQASVGACSHCLLHTSRDSQAWGGLPTWTAAEDWTGTFKQRGRSDRLRLPNRTCILNLEQWRLQRPVGNKRCLRAPGSPWSVAAGCWRLPVAGAQIPPAQLRLAS